MVSHLAGGASVDRLCFAMVDRGRIDLVYMSGNGSRAATLREVRDKVGCELAPVEDAWFPLAMLPVQVGGHAKGWAALNDLIEQTFCPVFDDQGELCAVLFRVGGRG